MYPNTVTLSITLNLDIPVSSFEIDFINQLIHDDYNVMNAHKDNGDLKSLKRKIPFPSLIENLPSLLKDQILMMKHHQQKIEGRSQREPGECIIEVGYVGHYQEGYHKEKSQPKKLFGPESKL